MKTYVQGGKGGGRTAGLGWGAKAHLWLCVCVGFCLVLHTRIASAQAPEVVSHIGFVEVGGVPFTGTGQFKIALVDAVGTTSYWSNDGTSLAGSEPVSWIITNLVDGRYSLGLGDTTVPNMTQPLSPAVVAQPGLYLRVWFNDGTHGFQQLVPDQALVSVPYALRASTISANAVGSAQVADGSIATADLADNSITTAKILDGAILSSDIANGAILNADLADNAVNSAKIQDGTITGADILDGTIQAADIATGAVTSVDILDGTILSQDVSDGSLTLSDFNLASVDVRYVLKTGDTMSGDLTLPNLNATGVVKANIITNLSGILSLKSRTDIELQLDLGGGASAAFEIFDGAGSHLFTVNESGNARTYGSHSIDDGLMVGTTALDANAVAQINFPNSVSVPHLRLKSALINNGFGIQYANPAETWFVGMNIGNWSDGRFNILADSSNAGLILSPAGYVRVGSVSDSLPFTELTVDGTIGFSTVSQPAMYVYESGISNADKRLIVHSPSFDEYGLYYQDDGDRFVMKSSANDPTPSLVVDLDSNWVTIATATPKSGYALSVDGRIVCEELLVENSTDWPDYVFDENYPLRSLEDVEAHIKEKKHLPGIPTAAEVAKNGISVGDMQKRLMEKVEELTLHLIDQNKRLAAQGDRIRQLEALVREAAGSKEAP